MTKQDIIKIICEVCGIELNDLKKRTKQQDIVMARQIIAQNLYSKLNIPLRDIATELNISVSNLYQVLFHNNINNRLRTDATFRERFLEIERKLNELR